MAQLRRQITQMMTIFDGYLNNEQSQLNQSNSDHEGYITALLMEVKKKMAAIDDALYQMNQGMVLEYNGIASKLANIDSSEVDSAMQSLQQRLSDWIHSQNAIVDNISSQSASITKSNPFTLTPIQNAITNTVKIAAATAIQFLKYYNIPIPDNLISINSDPVGSIQTALNAAAVAAAAQTTTTAAPTTPAVPSNR
jgi:hypothetical protein